MTVFSKVLKLVKSSAHISVPSYGPFAALKRQVILAKHLYPQYITWNQSNWKPEPTPKSKLIPWYLLTFLVTIITLNLLYTGVREITAHTKDPDIGLIEAIVLVFFISANVISTAAFYIYISKVDEICFVLSNMQVLKKIATRQGEK